MKKIITTVLAAAMLLSSLCACTPAKEEQPPLPESYNLLDENRVTGTKDQYSTGMCAAFSTIKAAESSIITDGYADANIDLSEAQLFYYSFSYQNEKDPENVYDGIFLPGNRTDANGGMFRYGAHSFNLLNSLANGHGPIDESVVEFDVKNYLNSVNNMHEAHRNGSISMDMSGDYLLTSYDVFRGLDSDDTYQISSIDTIKHAIINNGAVLASTAYGEDIVKKRKEYTAFYAGVNNDYIFDRINHGITLIGWDDNFSRENFGYYKPENNGAWLVQNSMGTTFGNEGVYLSSFEEALAGIVSVNFCPRDSYGDILSHDSLWMFDVIQSKNGDTVTANIFTTEKNCALKAVGVPTSAINQPVTVEVYRNPDKNTPDSGKRAAKLTATIEYPGYHVVDLKKTVELTEGDTISIVVTYRTDKTGGNEWLGKVPVEGDFTEEEKAAYLPMEYRFCSQPGESFVVYDGKWYDTSDPATAKLFGKEVTLNNFGIKVLMEKE